MLTRWLISVPVYGERYVDEFCAATLPALKRATARLAETHDVDIRLVVHTDQPDHIRGMNLVHGGPQPRTVVECRPVPAGASGLACMSQAHREVIHNGMLGDVVVLLTAGAVISEDGLKYCADVLANRQIKAVLCAVPRVLAQGIIPDTGDAAKFMEWAWENRHPLTSECTWPLGKSSDLSRAFFVRDDVVVTRMTLPHPLAVRIDGRVLRFEPTIDANLNLCFDPSEMHMTPNCKELAVVKLTPADKGYALDAISMEKRVSGELVLVANGHQRWCLSHQVRLCGHNDPMDCGDAYFVSMLSGKR